MPNPVMTPSFEGLVTTANIKREENKRANFNAEAKEEQARRLKSALELREKFQAEFTEECVDLLLPRLRFGWHSYPNVEPGEPEIEATTADFLYQFGDEKIRMLLWTGAGTGAWYLTWIDRAGLSHNSGFAL